jgi:hypothetical protein
VGGISPRSSIAGHQVWNGHAGNTAVGLVAHQRDGVQRRVFAQGFAAINAGPAPE